MTDDIARRRFHEHVLPHLDDVYSLARWITGDTADAEDVAQEACLRAFKAFAVVSPERPRAFLLTVTRNAAYSWLSKNRSRALVLAGAAEEAEAQACADIPAVPSQEEAMIAASDQASVTEAIATLPLAFREVLVLREINGLSYRDIAEATGAPLGTVMSRLARARALLAERLGALR